MKANRLPSLLAVVVLVASGLYFFVYLWRWEWNRAVVAGVLFLAAEVGLATVVVLNRIGRLVEQARPETLSRVRETAPPPRDHFACLRPRDEMGVFVPVLMGVGVVASVLAWVVERLARATAGPALERGLAGRLGRVPGHGVAAVVDPGVIGIGDGRFLLSASPAVGEHAWRKLQGCLEDMTVDRVRAHVVSKRDVAASPR